MRSFLLACFTITVSLFLAACSNSSSSPAEPGLFADITSSAYTNCARTHSGTFKCWGYGDNYNFANGLGETIGDDPEETGEGIPAAQLGDTPILHAETNEYFGCALYVDNTVKCWGDKDYVGLGDPSTDPSSYVGDDPAELGNGLPVINFGHDLYATQLSLGNGHACVVLNNGRVKCWGDGGDGRLGYGNTDNIGDDPAEMGDNLPFVDLGLDSNSEHYTVKQVAAGYDLTCAVLNNDQLKCWGENDSAQLGYGDFNDRGDNANEMGENLPLVDLGAGRSVKKVFTYYVHTCAILENDALKCWGDNRDGEIGLATGDDFVGDNVVQPRGNYYCNAGAQIMRYQSTVINPDDPGCTLGGTRYEIGLDTNSNGLFDAGEFSTGSEFCDTHDLNLLTRVTSLDPGHDQCADGGFRIESEHDTNNDGLFSDGNENYMGNNLPEIDMGSSSPVVDVVLGDDHTCALLADGTMKCWGDNDYAQAGLDTVDAWGTGAGETPANRESPDLGVGRYPVAISGSYEYSCALLNDDSIKCWGYDSDYGTLGVPAYFDEYIGDGNPANEMGEALLPVELF